VKRRRDRSLFLGLASWCAFCPALLLGERSARAEQASPPNTVVVYEAPVRHVPLPDESLGYHQPVLYPTLPWALLQLVPSPEIAVGRLETEGPSGEVDSSTRAAFGLRWQLTPLLWSFGVHPRQSRWRSFLVDPSARHSGSIELSASFEYIGGHVDRLLARPGLRVYLPVAHKGEYLSVSLGTSIYDYDGARVAYDAGVYLLGGFVGLQVTVAPAHAPLGGIATLSLRCF
jgi:hypothetical protein